jgi:NAD(P)-dependent dehydrogenase (short-subunit alcohol dehydrogenase family)
VTYNILITGANRGLGLALASQFLALGHQVVALNRRHDDVLRRLQDQYPDLLHLYHGDVSDEDAIQKGLAEISRQVDHLDIVVNNAAVHLDQAAPLIEDVDFSVFLPTFQVNAVGPLVVIKHALPLLRRGQKKLIINVSSEAGSIGNAWRKSEYAYCMSKAALNMATQILQNGLKEEGIKVLALHPGWFSSDMGSARAPITPAEAAETAIDLILGPLDSETMFVAPNGEVLAW